jgi:hypothetical protein
MKPFVLPNSISTLLNAELSDRQLIEHTTLKSLTLPSQRMNITYTSHMNGFKVSPRVAAAAAEFEAVMP